MNSLSNLLTHEIVDLYSAEEQIIEALPQMIEKANNQELKKALKDHLKQTEQHKKRLEKVHKMIQQEDGSSEEELGDTTCMGMKGLIEEGKKAMEEDMDSDVMDAAIIASAQKIEHYEISGYGTACAFARELELSDVEKTLQQTLDEEYNADDLLTDLAVGNVNMEAEEEGVQEISVRKIPANNGRKSSSRATSQRSSGRSSARSASPNGSSTRKSAGRTSGRTKKSASSGRSRKSTTSRSKSSSGSSGRSSSRSRSKSSRSR